MKKIVKTKVTEFAGNQYSNAKKMISCVYSDNTAIEKIFDDRGKLIETYHAKTSHFNLFLFGKENAKKARDFIGGGCVRGIYDHGKRLAQIEDVLEDLVFVGYIESSANVEKVIKQLSRIGFTGLCEIEENWEDIFEETICAIEL